jgi:hypothetical protein
LFIFLGGLFIFFFFFFCIFFDELAFPFSALG